MDSAKQAAFLGVSLYLTYLPFPGSSLPDEPLLYLETVKQAYP